MAFTINTNYYYKPVFTGCLSFPSGKSIGTAGAEQAVTANKIIIASNNVCLLNIYFIHKDALPHFPNMHAALNIIYSTSPIISHSGVQHG